MVINNIITASQAKGFTLLMGAFTTPEEIFGPFMLSALQRDEYIRNLADRLCEADTAFLDECFKSSGAALNSLLTIMQERMYDNGGARVKCPLRTLFAASNEMPDPDANLGALYDRFALRVVVKPMDRSQHKRLWFSSMPAAKPVCTIADFEAVGAKAKQTPWSPQAEEVYAKIVYGIQDDLHIVLGDRRTRKAVSICQANAALDGANEVLPRHLDCLRWMFWESTDQYDAVSNLVMRESDPDRMKLEEFMKEIEAVKSKMPQTTEAAGPVYLKVKEMVSQMREMQSSRMRDAMLPEAKLLEAKLQAVSTGKPLAVVERLMRSAAADLPPVPV
jgi:MoxR-like ATPase